MRIESLPKLKISRSLQQLTYTFRLTNTRHFYHDTPFLTFQFLDIRLNNTEFIDTGTYHIKRVIDGRLHLFTQYTFYLRVSTLRRNLALQLLCCKQFGQLMTRCILMIILDEKRNKVALTFFFFRLSLLQRLHESSTRLMIGQCFDYVRNANLKDNVHTSLQIEAQTDLCLQTFLIRVDTKILHRVLVILLGNGIFQFGCLTIIIARSYRERQVEDTCKRQ